MVIEERTTQVGVLQCVYKFLGVLLVISLIWYPAIFWIIPQPSTPYYQGTPTISAELIEGNETIGVESGFSVATSANQATNKCVILNQTPFKFRNDWSVHYADSPWRGSNYSDTNYGALVQLGPSLELVEEEFLTFYYYFVISVVDVDKVNVYINGSGLKGTGSLRLALDCLGGEILGGNHIENIEETQFSITISSQIPTLLPDQDIIRNLLLRLEFNAFVPFEVLIESVIITAESRENLCELVFDYLDTSGNSIKNQRFATTLDNTPTLNITGNGVSGTVYTHHSNETIFLREGTYSIEELENYQCYDFSIQKLNVTLQQNQSTWIGFHHYFPRLYLHVQPEIPSLFLIMSGCFSFFSEYLVQPYPQFIYLPTGRILFMVDLVVDDNTWDVVNSHNLLPDYHFSNGTADWTLEITTNMREVNNIAIPDYLAVTLFFVPPLIAGEMTIHVGNKDRKITELWKSPEFYSVLLLVSSILFPWASFRTGNNWQFIYYLPLVSDLISVNTSIEVFSSTKIGDSIAYGAFGGFIFWAILGLTIILAHVQFKNRDLTIGCLLSLSFALSLRVLVQSLQLPIAVGIGTYLTLVVFPLWLTLKGIIHLKRFSNTM